MCNKQCTKVAIVTNVIPSYRRDFYDRIFANREVDVTVYCQERIPGMNLATIRGRWENEVIYLNAYSMKKERLVWQALPIKKLYSSYDVVIFYGNPRIVSSVIYATLLKLLGRKVVIWGQVHTARANKYTERIRLTWWRMFKYFFVYNDHEIDKLKSKGFSNKIIVAMNNGLDQGEIDRVILNWNTERLDNWRRKAGIHEKVVMLSCARLEEKNRFDMVVRAMPRLISRIPNIVWCVIGDGPEANSLKALAKRVGVDEKIVWCGEIYEEEELAPWFLSSAFYVHPAGIGLSVMHAFGYGLPVIADDNVLNHMPEYFSLKPEVNGVLFRSGDISDLVEKVMSLVGDVTVQEEMKENAFDEARMRCNTSVMANRFFDLIARIA